MSFLVKDTEKKKTAIEKRQKFHLYMTSEVISELSGICRFNEKTHIYCISTPKGTEEKSICGHFTTENFIKYKKEAPIILPDSIFDQSGVLGGSALSEKNGITLFYTGLVKKAEPKEEKCDEKNIVKVFSEDGFSAGKKNVLLEKGEVEKSGCFNLSHPKVWRTEEGFFMMLGASFEEKGCAAIFFSHDLEKWHFYKRITSKESMGSMWNHPDAFVIDGAAVLNVSVESEKKPTSGFCFLTENEAYGFHALDFGDDFYSPQSFKDEKGRRILLGVIVSCCQKEENAFSCLTLPRILTRKKGRLYQELPEEISFLRESRRIVSLERGERCDTFGGAVFEAILRFSGEAYSVFLRDNILLQCENSTITITKTGTKGRESRSFYVDDRTTVRIFSDAYTIEIFIDGKSYTSYVKDSQKGGIYIAEGSCRGEIYQLLSCERS